MKCDLIAESTEQYINFVMSQDTPVALSKEEISLQSNQKRCPLKEVIHLISTGQRDNLKSVEGVDPNTPKIFCHLY